MLEIALCLIVLGLFVNRCDCCDLCECIMCGTGEDCGETRTVTITHGADLIEMTHFDSQDEDGGTTLAEIMASLEIAVSGGDCAPTGETEVYPYCSFTGTGNLGIYLYAILFYFDGSTWWLRILITNTGDATDVHHYSETDLATADVNCDTFEEEYVVPRCEVSGGNPDETILVTIAA
jgi:hypothetical protein